jgi:hypothetical protein
MPGILDFLNQPDAQLGMGLLASGGPTTDPNQTGIGQRVAGAVNSVQAQQQNAIKTKLMAAQQQEAMQNAQMQQFQLKRLQDWQSMVMGDSAGQSPMGSSPASTAQAGGVMPSGADSMGGGAAPGGMPSGATPQSGYPQAPQTPQNTQPAQNGGRSFQFAIPGLGDQQSRVLAASMPPADYLKMYAGAAVPQTDIGKLMVQAGIDPKSPLGLQMTQQSIAKANYIAPVNGRPGGWLAGADGSLMQLPHVPDGSTAFKGPDGQFHIVPLDGGFGAISNAEAAKKAGTNTQTLTTGVDSGNQPVYRTAAQDVNAANGMSTQPAGDGRFPSAQGASQGAGVIRPGLSAAGQAASVETGKGSAQQLVNDNTSANGFSTRMFTLGKALTGLQGANTGPGSEALNNIKSFIAARGIPGVDVNKIASYDEANKYLMQYAIGQAGALGEGTDGKLAATLSGNANTHISSLAAQDVVRANMGLERMKQAQVQQFNNTNLPSEQYQKWATQWNKQVNPQVFVWDSMPADKKQLAMSNMSNAQKQAFTGQYNWALQNKFIDGSQ